MPRNGKEKKIGRGNMPRKGKGKKKKSASAHGHIRSLSNSIFSILFSLHFREKTFW